jgi:hypothetical protein
MALASSCFAALLFVGGSGFFPRALHPSSASRNPEHCSENSSTEPSLRAARHGRSRKQSQKRARLGDSLLEDDSAERQSRTLFGVLAV